ncbi:MAG: hypothetical protein KZQ84_10770 [Candidatus Thiodiazotropha sp. (ex Lucinoma borealis)]|nr:hypothetical protein [Candidatus Thiodiazotropha sp. (ex Lucinoma borealis)]
MSITTLLSLVGDILTVGGAFKKLFNNPERQEIEKYILFLEQRRVLFAQFDQELKQPVIQSISEIKQETEKLRTNVTDNEIRKLLAKLIRVMQNELDNLWAYESTHREGQKKMFMSIQRFRTEMAKSLAILCYSYGIDPRSTELQELIVNMATVRPTNNVAR